jgi:hypothetical protein
MMRRILGIWIVVTLAIILTACSNSEKDKSKPQKPPVEEKLKTNLPLTKNIEVEIEGIKEQRSAELMQNANGYHFYILDLYNFEKENNTTGKIVFANEPSLYATIEKLDKTADIESLKESSIKLAEQTGKASEWKGTDIYFPYFHDAKFYVKGISER